MLYCERIVFCTRRHLLFMRVAVPIVYATILMTRIDARRRTFLTQIIVCATNACEHSICLCMCLVLTKSLKIEIPYLHGDYVAVTWRLRGSDVDSTPQCIPYILSALPYVPGGPTIHQHDPRRHYLICGRQSIRRQTRCACDVKSCAVVLC